MYASLAIAALAAVPALAQTFVAPKGDNVDNPVYEPSPRNEPTIGVPYTITWGANTTTKNGKCDTVTLWLLAGNGGATLVPEQQVAAGIANSGKYEWTPSASIKATPGYGIELICDQSGDFQYSELFAIKREAGYGSTTPSTPTTPAATKGADVTGADLGPTGKYTWVTDVVSHYTTYCPEATTVAMGNKTYTVHSATTLTITDCPCTVSYKTTAAPIAPTVAPSYPVHYGNETVVQPIGTVSQVLSTYTTSTTPVSPVETSSPATPEESPIYPASGAAALSTSFGAIVAVLFAVLVL